MKNMKLHEVIEIFEEDYIQVTRVKGGWIYRYHYDCSGCFVPDNSNRNFTLIVIILLTLITLYVKL